MEQELITLPINYVFWLIIIIMVAWFGGGIVTYVAYWQNAKEQRELRSRYEQEYKAIKYKHELLTEENLKLRSELIELRSQLQIALSRIDDLSSEIADHNNENQSPIS